MPVRRNTMIQQVVPPFVVSLMLALVAVPLCRLAAVRTGFLARPRQDRWHRRSLAMFGGVGIAIAVFASAAWFGLVTRLPVVIATVALIFVTGLTDDFLSLKPTTKLIAQLALASALLSFGYRLNWLEAMTGDALLTLVWVVGLTNAFNLIDNMDGLCAGISLIVGTALLIDLAGRPGGASLPQATYLAIVLGATAGFLVYNVYPASIFMGDSGSMLLGFSMATLTLSVGAHTRGRSDILAIVAGPVLVLLVPIFDTALVTLSRWTAGRPASQGGADHSSHRLVAIGLSERRAVALLWLLGAVGGGLGIALRLSDQQASVVLPAAVFLIAMTLFAAYLTGVRVYDEDDARVQTGALTPILVEFMYQRRVAEVLLDFCLVSVCYYASYRLRFEDPEEFLRNFDIFLKTLPIIVACQMIAFFIVGVYRGVWRHFGMADTLIVARGVFFGVVSAQVTILYAYRVFAFSRTVFVIYGVLLLLAMTLSRASFRIVGEFMHRQRQTGERVVIYGAGDSGGMVMRELLALDGDVRILGFVDDDPRKAGMRQMGYHVLGGFSALTVLIKAASVDRVVVSARHVPAERLNNLRVLCSDNNVTLSQLTVGLETLVEGQPVESAGAVPASKIRQFPS